MGFSINGRCIGPNFPPFVIAELSGNHNGSIEVALDTIKAAKDAGADAIKLQTYTAESLTIDCDLPDFMINGGLWNGYKLFDLYRLAQTPYEWHQKLFDYAKSLGLIIFSTPFDENAVDFLEDLNSPAYKIASFELVDLPLIEYVARKGKPMIMSTGLATDEDIADAIAVAKQAGCNDIALLHCISSYPAPMAEANLLKISTLSEKYNITIGLSDHTIGDTAAVASVAIGATIIEKHFILKRSNGGPDAEFSMEPGELKELCIRVKDAWLAKGTGAMARSESELQNRVFRRSLYFVRNMSVGEVVGPQDIKRIRPGFGLSPKYYDAIVGRKLKVSVVRGQPTAFEQFEN
jgi:pseudaminic acid synthase